MPAIPATSRTWARTATALSLCVAASIAWPSTADAATGPTVLFVVDTSDSMTGDPLVQAKGALREGIAVLGAGQSAGLRSYGGGCGDGGQLLVPVASGNSSALNSATDGLTADGGTPTPDALRAAAADLPSTGERTIILISDGDSSCGDPCIAAAELEKELGIGFKVHTVGFNAPENAESELTCISQATGGKYYQATDGASLSTAISTATEEAVAVEDESEDSATDTADDTAEDAEAAEEGATVDTDTGAVPVGGVKTGAGPTADSDGAPVIPALATLAALAAATALGTRWVHARR